MPVIIVLIVFGSILTLIKMLLTHNRDKMLAQTSMEGSSMRLSELENMVTDRISEAIEPLASRVDELESAHLLETSKQMLLDPGETVSVDAKNSAQE